MPNFVPASNNPAAAAAAVREAFVEGPKVAEIPVIPLFHTDGLVELPGGLLTPEGTLITQAEVRELTGRDEEAIIKARMSGKPSRYVRALLKAGVVSIGGHEVSDAILDDLLLGDRDALILGIRRATYGDEVELFGVQCPACEATTDMMVTLDDIPFRKMEDQRKRAYDVPLRKGGHVTIRLPVGADQARVADNINLTLSEQSSVILGCCMLSRTMPDGSTIFADNAEAARDLGLADRRALMSALEKNQPGPRYDEVMYTCENCETEVPLGLTVGHLFSW